MKKRNAVPITRVGSFWVIRPRVTVLENGEPRTVQRAIKVARCEGHSKTPPREVLDAAAEEIRRLRGARSSPLRSMRLGEFFDDDYMDHVKVGLKPSVSYSYRLLWDRYISGSQLPGLWLRDVRTSHIQVVIEDTRRTFSVFSRTLARLKHLLSGIFRLAIQRDLAGPQNPAREAQLPRAQSKKDEPRYNQSEVKAILPLLDDRCATIVAVAFYAALREGRDRGASMGVLQTRRLRRRVGR